MKKFNRKMITLFIVLTVLIFSSIFVQKFDIASYPALLRTLKLVTESEVEYINIEIGLSGNLGGSVEGAGKYISGELISVVATTHQNYIFAGWEKNGELVSDTEIFEFLGEEDVLLKANFKLDYSKIGEEVFIDGNELLALVTKETNLGSYHPDDLVELPKMLLARPQWSYFLREAATEKLEEMWLDAKEQGVALYVASAFRDYQTQETIFAQNVAQHGEEIANQRSARPGESEHQLGTVVDFSEDGEGRLTQAFEDTPAGKWLIDNAHKYGFAMSYPKGKEDVTGYIYEPWHYRYIGIDAASQWKESGQALSEFLNNHPQKFIDNTE